MHCIVCWRRSENSTSTNQFLQHLQHFLFISTLALHTAAFLVDVEDVLSITVAPNVFSQCYYLFFILFLTWLFAFGISSRTVRCLRFCQFLVLWPQLFYFIAKSMAGFRIPISNPLLSFHIEVAILYLYQVLYRRNIRSTEVFIDNVIFRKSESPLLFQAKENTILPWHVNNVHFLELSLSLKVDLLIFHLRSLLACEHLITQAFLLSDGDFLRKKLIDLGRRRMIS